LDISSNFSTKAVNCSRDNHTQEIEKPGGYFVVTIKEYLVTIRYFASYLSLVYLSSPPQKLEANLPLAPLHPLYFYLLALGWEREGRREGVLGIFRVIFVIINLQQQWREVRDREKFRSYLWLWEEYMYGMRECD
jgi:hypothetical protein